MKFILILCILALGSSKFTHMVNNLDFRARCLDGSSPAIIFEEGSTPENILIYPMALSSCAAVGTNINESLDDCVRRTKTWEGSSKFSIPEE